jgi:hypothetical protein
MRDKQLGHQEPSGWPFYHLLSTGFPRNSSGSFATLAAIHRASSSVNLAARQLGEVYRQSPRLILQQLGLLIAWPGDNRLAWPHTCPITLTSYLGRPMTGDPYFWIVALAIALVISIGLARSYSRAAETERASSRKKDEQLSILREAHVKHLAAVEAQYKKLLDHMRGMEKIFEQRKIQMESERDAQTLETKKHPAIRSATRVRDHGRKKREAERQARLMRYRVEYYETLFPWLADYVGDDVPHFAVEASGSSDDASDDPVKASAARVSAITITSSNYLAFGKPWWRASVFASNEPLPLSAAVLLDHGPHDRVDMHSPDHQ